MADQNLSYPIGTYIPPKTISPEHIKNWIKVIALLPEHIEALVNPLNEEQLLWRYRPNGWTMAQVVHHLADSHLNAYMRFKIAITEDQPTIRPYDEVSWAEHTDATTTNLTHSLTLLKGLHGRWAEFLNTLSAKDLNKTFYHPGREQMLDLAFTIGDYAWHGAHHTAHIKQALKLKFRD